MVGFRFRVRIRVRVRVRVRVILRVIILKASNSTLKNSIRSGAPFS
jgi:hypothetical protein